MARLSASIPVRRGLNTIGRPKDAGAALSANAAGVVQPNSVLQG